MKTAIEKSDYYIWLVLDKIMQQALPGRLSEVFYTFSADITRSNPISFMDERKALEYLQNNNIIKKIGDDVVVESGKKGTPGYSVEEIYRFRLNKNFYDFHDRYTIKVLGTDPDNGKKVMAKLIKNLVVSLTGKYKKKLILLLSKKDLTAKELEETGAKDVRHLISNTNKEIKKRRFEIVLTNIKTRDGLRKYHLRIS